MSQIQIAQRNEILVAEKNLEYMKAHLKFLIDKAAVAQVDCTETHIVSL